MGIYVEESRENPDTKYHINIIGKVNAIETQKAKLVTENLIAARPYKISGTVEQLFESDYKTKLDLIKRLKRDVFLLHDLEYLCYVETSDNMTLYFQTIEKFVSWAERRFKYESDVTVEQLKDYGITEFNKLCRSSNNTFYSAPIIGLQEPVSLVFEIFDKEVPKTAKHFESIADSGKYNGTVFHRVESGYFVQAGDIKNGSGANGGDVRIPCECLSNPFMDAGLVAMASNETDNLVGSQFFITLRPLPQLFKMRVVVGRVVEGLGAIEEVSQAPSKNSRPIQPLSLGEFKKL